VLFTSTTSLVVAVAVSSRKRLAILIVLTGFYFRYLDCPHGDLTPQHFFTAKSPTKPKPAREVRVASAPPFLSLVTLQ